MIKDIRKFSDIILNCTSLDISDFVEFIPESPLIPDTSLNLQDFSPDTITSIVIINLLGFDIRFPLTQQSFYRTEILYSTIDFYNGSMIINDKNVIIPHIFLCFLSILLILDLAQNIQKILSIPV